MRQISVSPPNTWPRRSTPPSLGEGATYLAVGLAGLGGVGVIALLGGGTSAVWLLVMLTAVVVLVLPTWALVPGAVLAGIATALIRMEVPSLVETLGQGRVAALIAVVAVAYALARRSDFRVPRPTIVAASLFAAAVLYAALVGVAQGRDGAETFTAVQRELSQSIAPLLVALIAFTAPAGRLAAMRMLGVVTIGASALALAYWGWVSGVVGVPGGLESLFEVARLTATERGVSPTRTIFPFVDTDPNSAAALFAMLTALSAGVLVASSRGGDRALAVVVMVAGAGGVIATQSRMGWLTLPALIVAYLLLTRGVPAAARWALVALVAVAAVVAVAMSDDLLAEDRRLTADDDNVQSRVAIWGEAIDDFALAPVTGHGLRHAAEPRYFHQQLSVHNEYLQRLIDGGPLAFAAFVAVLVAFGAMAFRLSRRSGPDAAIGRAALVAMSAVLVSMLVIASWTGTPLLQVLSWLLFGIISAVYAAPNEETPEATAAGGVQPDVARRAAPDRWP